MTIIQLAKVLQLAGFLFASVFGGILLDEVVGGKVANGFNSLLVGFIGRLSEFTQKQEKRVRIIDEEDRQFMWSIWVMCSYWVAALTTLIIGGLEHISVLLWVGVGLYSLMAIGFLVGWPGLILVSRLVPRIRPLTSRILGKQLSERKLSPKEYFRKYGLVTIAAASGIAWLLILAIVFLSFLLKTSGSAMRTLANPRVPKAAFVVIGYLALLAGLIIDATAAF